MGLANWLTIVRILLVPVLVICVVYNRALLAFGTFVVAGVTDMMDGYIARTRGTKTRLGAFLDPLADKLLLTASFVTLTYKYPKVLPFWLTVIVLSRDLLLILVAVLIMLTGGQLNPTPTALGKASTMFQMLTVGVALLVVGGATTSGCCGRRSWPWRPCSRSRPGSSTCCSPRAMWTGVSADAQAGSRDRGASAGSGARGAGGERRSPTGRPPPPGERPTPAGPRRLPRPGRRGGARHRRRPERPAVLGGAPATVGAGPRSRVRAAGTRGDLDLRQQVRVLLHPPAAPGPAEEPVREGRRLPALVPPRQLHHADRSAGQRGPAHRRPASVAALHLRARHGPGAASLPAREPEDHPRRSDGAPPPSGRGRDPPAHADRPLSRAQRRAAPRTYRARAGGAASRRGDRGRRAGRAHPSSRGTLSTPVDHAVRGGRDSRCDPRVAGGVPGPPRDPSRLRGGRAVSPGGPRRSRLRRRTRGSRWSRTASGSSDGSRTISGASPRGRRVPGGAERAR